MKVNAGTDTELINHSGVKRQTSRPLLKGRKIIIDRNGSQTLINVEADGVKAVEKDNQSMRNMGLPVYNTSNNGSTR